MPGTLIPPWFHPNIPTRHDEVIVSIIWGMSLGLSLFGVIRAGIQTYHQWQRTGAVTIYMMLIWLELLASTLLGGIGWGYVHLALAPSFEIFFCLLLLWAIQIHCIMQIIVNRIALLAVSPALICRLRWGIFTLLILINISVFCIWIPARLQISHRWIHLNNIWDRVEKGIFALVDAGLNLYFIHLVRSSLISLGLTKYVVLYRFNLAMIAISIGMDILIIGMMSLKNTFLYVLFHPLAYLVKLHIELSMAELIAKIVKSSSRRPSCNCACHNNHSSRRQSCSLPAHSVHGHPNKGTIRWIWPVWTGNSHERSRSYSEDSLVNRPRKTARLEARPRRFSWSQRFSSKDSAMSMSTLPSPTERCRRSHDFGV